MTDHGICYLPERRVIFPESYIEVAMAVVSVEIYGAEFPEVALRLESLFRSLGGERFFIATDRERIELNFVLHSAVAETETSHVTQL